MVLISERRNTTLQRFQGSGSSEILKIKLQLRLCLSNPLIAKLTTTRKTPIGHPSDRVTARRREITSELKPLLKSRSPVKNKTRPRETDKPGRK